MATSQFRPSLAISLDLDGDGRPEVLQAFSLTTERQVNSNDILKNSWQQWFVVLIDGRDGALRWFEPITDVNVQQDRSYFTNSGFVKPQMDASADLNGDGTHDVLMTIPQKDPKGWWFLTIHALSGRDGKRLWGPIAFEGEWQFDYEIKSPLIRDLDGDGKNEIVVLESKQPRIRVLRGDTGETLWIWENSHSHNATIPDIVVVEQSTHLPGQGQLEKPARHQCVATTVSETGSPTEIVLVDHAGKVIARTPHAATRLWSDDLDEDGRDELLRLVDKKLTATRGLGAALWEWSPPNGEDFQVSYFDRTADGRVVVAMSSNDSLLLLDGLTGKPLNRTRRSCDTTYQTGQRILALNRPKQSTKGGPLRMVTCTGDGRPLIDQIVSRVVLPTSDDGRYAPSDEGNSPSTRVSRSVRVSDSADLPTAGLPNSSTARVSDSASNEDPPTEGPHNNRGDRRSADVARSVTGHNAKTGHNAAADDPRLVRQLPWAPPAHEWSSLWIVTTHAIMLSLVTLLIPFWMIRAGMRRRELGWWRGVLIIAGFVVLTLSISLLQSLTPSPARGGIPLSAKLAMAFGALPILVWPSVLLHMVFGGRWRGLKWLLGGTLAGSSLIAAMMLIVDSAKLLPEQHYAWHGWWFILFLGAYAVGGMFVVWRVIGPGVCWLWNNVYRRKFIRHV